MRSKISLLLTLVTASLASTGEIQAADIGRLFPSAEEAADAIAQAAKDGNKAAIVEILGPASADLVETGDEVAQKNAMAEFSRAYEERHQLKAISDLRRSLIIGKEHWPFPIPLVKLKPGWFFNVAAGREEILNRRIGENELNAVSVCRAYVEAQKEYAAARPMGNTAPEFAQRMMSSPGKKDGLFWPVSDGEEPSPFGPLVAKAASEGYIDRPEQADPYHGYIFRILTAQGNSIHGGAKSYINDGRMTDGFALIAYPSQWGSSGVMTFLVNHDGNVFEKDLGEQTATIAGTVAEYNPDDTWHQVP